MKAICLGPRWSGSICIGGDRPSGRARPRLRTRPLGCRQQASACHVQIRQTATDDQPVGILRQPTVPDFGPPEDPLDHQEHVFDFGTNLRFRPVLRLFVLTQGAMAIGFGLDELASNSLQSPKIPQA